VLLLDDGLIVLDVEKVDRQRVPLHACAVGGVLSNNKGINQQGGGLTAPRAHRPRTSEDIKHRHGDRAPTTWRCRSRRPATTCTWRAQLHARRGRHTRC
jgi:hypothetical protein